MASKGTSQILPVPKIGVKAPFPCQLPSNRLLMVMALRGMKFLCDGIKRICPICIALQAKGLIPIFGLLQQ